MYSAHTPHSGQLLMSVMFALLSNLSYRDFPSVGENLLNSSMSLYLETMASCSHAWHLKRSTSDMCRSQMLEAVHQTKAANRRSHKDMEMRVCKLQNSE